MKITEFDRKRITTLLTEVRTAKTVTISTEAHLYCQGIFAGLLMAGAVNGDEYCKLMDLTLNAWSTRFKEIHEVAA